ncbi:MAG: hypothetical protein K8823_225 [Cenarchaeum symbiont of Oopsacas minuta]|nr:hypothetical protein [Cenarchaeum symbiont of Oopsacas minuta]
MTIQREFENEFIQELPHGYYQSISSILGTMVREKYGGIEEGISIRLYAIASELATLLLHLRLEKITTDPKITRTNLLDEEKFILDSNTDMNDRKNMILTGILHGNSKLLESISIAQKTKPILVRFLQDAEQIIGVDMAKYGPFKAEDIASIPYDNAQAFIAKKIVSKVMIDDKQSS